VQKIIKAKGLVDVNKQALINNVVIVIDNDTITSIDNELRSSQIHPEAQIIDLSDQFILPGLINGHLHLCDEADPKIRQNKEFLLQKKELAVMIASCNSRKELMSGVTTVRDCGGWNMSTVRLAAELGFLEGPRIYHCGRLLTMTGGHGWDLGEETDGIDGIIRSVRQNFKEGADFIKLMVTGGGTPFTFPGYASFSVQEIAAATETAHQINKRVAVHARGTEGIKSAIEGGVDIIEHCCFELPDKTLKYDPKLAEEIAKKEIYVTPTVQLYRDRLKELTRMKDEGTLTLEDQKTLERTPYVLEEKYVALRGFCELGIKCIAGNDAGIPGLEFGSLSGELETMVEAGMTPMQAIISATKIPAEAMNLSDEIGSLEVGKQADIIATKGDPTANILELENINFVMKAGEVHLR
jgi:imidazolonepropionase-like amidohydrolase